MRDLTPKIAVTFADAAYNIKIKKEVVINQHH